MLIMKRYAVSQIYCFTYILFIAVSALYYVNDILVLQDMLSFTVNTLSLKYVDGPSVINLQRPHRGSLHFVTWH